jgi:hypothetical protein
MGGQQVQWQLWLVLLNVQGHLLAGKSAVDSGLSNRARILRFKIAVVC